MYVWIHQHVLGHHPYTNIDGADPDIATAAPVSLAILCMQYQFDCAHEFYLGSSRCPQNQVGTEMAAALFLPAHLRPYAVLCCKLTLLKIL